MLKQSRKIRDYSLQPEDQSIKYLPLTKGQRAIVDAEDFEELSQWCWTFNAKTRRPFRGIAAKEGVPQVNVLMHRQIMRAENGQMVDHINRDTLDNRKANLRFCNKSQNAANSVRTKRKESSNYRGVSWSKQNKKWEGGMLFGGIRNRRHFDSEVEAAAFVDSLAHKFHGEFAVLNFPKDQGTHE